MKFNTGFLAGLIALLLMSVSVQAQVPSLPTFLKEKQLWGEKLVVIYAPKSQHHLVQDQINALYPHLTTLKKSNIVVVQLPTALSQANKNYLQQKLHYQKDRLNVWVFDEQGTLRLSSTRPTSAEQLLRILDVDNRSYAIAKAQFFRD
jgi:hypothetical protein